MLGFDAETAAVARFILSAAEELVPCYGNMPQDFSRPCVFFPPPEIGTAAGSLSSYVMRYTWRLLFFDESAEKAYARAAGTVEEIKKRRNLLPLYDEDGNEGGGCFRLKDAAVSRRDRGEAELLIMWDSFRRFGAEESKKMLFYDAVIKLKD